MVLATGSGWVRALLRVEVVGIFQRLHEALGSDLKATVRFLTQDPSGALASERLDRYLAAHPVPRGAAGNAAAPASPPVPDRV